MQNDNFKYFSAYVIVIVKRVILYPLHYQQLPFGDNWKENYRQQWNTKIRK